MQTSGREVRHIGRVPVRPVSDWIADMVFSMMCVPGRGRARVWPLCVTTMPQLVMAPVPCAGHPAPECLWKKCVGPPKCVRS